jgi:hypothetical protein
MAGPDYTWNTGRLYLQPGASAGFLFKTAGRRRCLAYAVGGAVAVRVSNQFRIFTEWQHRWDNRYANTPAVTGHEFGGGIIVGL